MLAAELSGQFDELGGDLRVIGENPSVHAEGNGDDRTPEEDAADGHEWEHTHDHAGATDEGVMGAMAERALEHVTPSEGMEEGRPWMRVDVRGPIRIVVSGEPGRFQGAHGVLTLP
jgi:hypothetical protein